MAIPPQVRGTDRAWQDVIPATVHHHLDQGSAKFPDSIAEAKMLQHHNVHCLQRKTTLCMKEIKLVDLHQQIVITYGRLQADLAAKTGPAFLSALPTEVYRRLGKAGDEQSPQAPPTFRHQPSHRLAAMVEQG